MLKLILIFRSLLWSQTFLVRRTRFLSVKITIYLFFNYYPMENRLEQRYFLKKSYVWATWSFYINPVYNKEIPDLSRSYLKFFPTFYRTNNNKANQDHWSNCDLYWSYAYELTWQNQSIRRHRFWSIWSLPDLLHKKNIPTQIQKAMRFLFAQWKGILPKRFWIF